MNYLFEHDTNKFDPEFQDKAWAWLAEQAGTGLEWPVGGHSLYVRVVIEVAWAVVADTRTAEAYKVAKWLYSVDFMKYQVSSEYNCEEPYVSKETIHAWLSSRPCPNWYAGHFVPTLWPTTALAEVGGNPDRELRKTVAYPLVEAQPSAYILEEVLLHFLWTAGPVGEVTLDHLDYSFSMTSMTKWTLLNEHDIDLDNLQQSAHNWLDESITIFSNKFWANPDVAAQLKSWSETYTVDPQLLTKYALFKELENEPRAACGNDGTTADNLMTDITAMMPYDTSTIAGRNEILTKIQSLYTSSGHPSITGDRLHDIWVGAGGSE
jgi:hypothetical protein